MSHTESTWSTAQKVDIAYRFKNIVRILLTDSANSYTFKHLNNGGSIQNDNTDSKCEIF